LRLIRDAAGASAYLVGCGAPILPSVGMVDAMRVSVDILAESDIIANATGADAGLLSMQLEAAEYLSARAFQHGRFWVNDPDCIIARPAATERHQWADAVRRHGGMRVSSDRIQDLDTWGLETTRSLLATAPAPAPFGAD
jgi:alpha-galactosidase